MNRDLPGQAVLFPEMEASHAEPVQAACRRSGGEQSAPAALGLPNKATCTVGEAHRYTGISKRQINYYVKDGTLLAVNSARIPVGQETAKRKGGKLDRWRIVVRRTSDFASDGFKTFQTLEEFINSRFNREVQ